MVDRKGSIQTITEAAARLKYLRSKGESDYTFTLRFIQRS